MYLGGATPDPVDPDISPIEGVLELTPPTVLILAGHDVLYDDGLAYGEALDAAGVHVETHVFPNLPHGFLDWCGAIEPGRDAVRGIASYVRERMLDR
jgi:acetyl esterase